MNYDITLSYISGTDEMVELLGTKNTYISNLLISRIINEIWDGRNIYLGRRKISNLYRYLDKEFNNLINKVIDYHNLGDIEYSHGFVIKDSVICLHLTNKLETKNYYLRLPYTTFNISEEFKEVMTNGLVLVIYEGGMYLNINVLSTFTLQCAILFFIHIKLHIFKDIELRYKDTVITIEAFEEFVNE